MKGYMMVLILTLWTSSMIAIHIISPNNIEGLFLSVFLQTVLTLGILLTG